MRRWILALGLALSLTLVEPTLRGGESRTPPARTFRELERAAKELAARGRGSAAERVLDVMLRLGSAGDDLEDLRTQVEQRLRRAGEREDPAPRAAKSLRRAAGELERWMEELPPEDRPPIAELVLALDGGSDACHELLGHVRTDGGWITKEAADCARRRAEIADAIRRARVLPVPVETGPSELAQLRTPDGRPGHVVRIGKYSLHSATVPPEKLARIAREAVRALALAAWLEGRKLEVAPPSRAYPIILLGSRKEYERGIEEALAHGGLSESEAKDAYRLAGFIDHRGPLVDSLTTEADETAYQLLALHDWCCEDWYQSRLQPCLKAGLVSWIALTYIGGRMPGIAWTERKGGAGPAVRSATKREEEEIRRMLRLSAAGIAGSRTYMRWLARRREDPPYEAAVLPAVGQITGDPLLKATFMAEYFFEGDVFPKVCAATRKTLTPASEFPTRLKDALGYALPELERRWRAWILPLQPGLAEQVEGESGAELPPDVRRVLARLGEIRERAGVDPTLGLDEATSAGCLAHARYLAKHRDQLSAWPDAHEEYPDREDFSPAGSRAGLSSVIAPGVSGPEEAVDAWLGTYFHRLPLLDPGLLRIGWALEGGIAVLDAGSFVAPPEAVAEVPWPPNGAKNVPTSFNPELPNPFPGEDQAAWGYPVTLQLFGYRPLPEVTLELRKGTGAGAEPVPCLFTSPGHPGNPDCAPRNAFALIPRAHLEPGTTYSVLASGFPDRADLHWNFRTGGR